MMATVSMKQPRTRMVSIMQSRMTRGGTGRPGDEVDEARCSAREGQDFAVGARNDDDHEDHDRHPDGAVHGFRDNLSFHAAISKTQKERTQSSGGRRLGRRGHSKENQADDHEDDDAEGQKIAQGRPDLLTPGNMGHIINRSQIRFDRAAHEDIDECTTRT